MIRLPALATLALLAAPLAAQVHTPGMVHTPDMTHAETVVPKEGGQAAFAAIAEIVAILDADPNTDWSKVNIEGLRQHLIDMDDVVMRSVVTSRAIAGGSIFDVTGTGRVAAAIGRMLPAHAQELDGLDRYVTTTAPIANGIRLTVTAAAPADTVTAARITALGLAGLLAEGAHHQPHHLAMARGAGGHH